jgi:hypothetical protein
MPARHIKESQYCKEHSGSSQLLGSQKLGRLQYEASLGKNSVRPHHNQLSWAEWLTSVTPDLWEGLNGRTLFEK